MLVIVGLAAALWVLCRKCRQPLFEIGVVCLHLNNSAMLVKINHGCLLLFGKPCSHKNYHAGAAPAQIGMKTESAKFSVFLYNAFERHTTKHGIPLLSSHYEIYKRVRFRAKKQYISVLTAQCLSLSAFFFDAVNAYAVTQYGITTDSNLTLDNSAYRFPAAVLVDASQETLEAKARDMVDFTFRQLMMQADRDSVADAGFHCNVCIVEDGGSLLIYVLYDG